MPAATPEPEADPPRKRPNADRPLIVRRALAAQGWWKSLNPQEISAEHGGGISPGDRATLAKLRRATTVYEVACEPAVANLYRLMALNGEHASDRDMIRAAVVAGVLAHVRKLDPKSRLASDMGRASGDRQAVSALRMRRFMAARDPDDVMAQFRRVLAMLDGKANPTDVALQVEYWLDPTEVGERGRTRFAFAYHGEWLAAPPSAEDASEPTSDPD